MLGERDFTKGITPSGGTPAKMSTSIVIKLRIWGGYNEKDKKVVTARMARV